MQCVRDSKPLPAILTTTAVLAVTFASACGGTESPPSEEKPDAVTPPTKTSSPPEPLPLGVGSYHRVGAEYATNLELRANGAFATEYRGCRDTSARCGAWRRNAAGNVILTASPTDPLYWSDARDNNRKATEVVFVQNGDTINASVTAADGETYQETWRPGGTCASCRSGELGQNACDVPIDVDCKP